MLVPAWLLTTRFSCTRLVMRWGLFCYRLGNTRVYFAFRERELECCTEGYSTPLSDACSLEWVRYWGGEATD